MNAPASPAIGSATIPEAAKSRPPSTPEEQDAAVAAVKAAADGWLRSSVQDRVALLDELLLALPGAMEGWVADACKAKGIAPGDYAEGEEWLGGPVVVARNLRLLRKTLQQIADTGRIALPKPAFVNAAGRVVCPVFPTDGYDGVLFQGFTAEVWQQPDVTLANLPEHMGATYQKRPDKALVALVLGAGNVSSIGPMDAFYKLFVEHQTVVLKMNPVNEYLGPHFERALAPLVRRDLLRVVYGGAAEGERLANHPGIDEIHITGSDKTHDAIVWGVGEECLRRKASHDPRNRRRVTSELGNVSPIVVVPGDWSQADLEFQAKNVVSSLTNNAGFNCNATRVLVTWKGWRQREAFLAAVNAAFAKVPDRKPYYPGAPDRHARFVAAHPEASQYGKHEGGAVPWTFISGLGPDDSTELCFTTEAWCGVTSEVALPADDAVAFVRAATAFANDTLWGTLSCSVIAHPNTVKQPALAKAVDDAVAALRYGSIAVNHWSALSYAFVSTTWGAYPGHPAEDIRSGAGVVHNTYLFDKPEKSVVRGPFRVAPKPAWFFDHKTGAAIGRKLCGFYVSPSALKIPSIVLSALGG